MLDIRFDENGSAIVFVTDKELLAQAVADCNEDEVHSDNFMAEVFEHFFANSEYDWIMPDEAGCLTDAPIFGTRHSDGFPDEVYGFMDYQVRSVVQDLIEKGEAFFTKRTFRQFSLG